MCIRIRGLKECRLRAGITQVEAARIVGISQNYYSDLERCKKTQPNESVILKLADAFSCSIDELYKGISKENAPQERGGKRMSNEKRNDR